MAVFYCNTQYCQYRFQYCQSIATCHMKIWGELLSSVTSQTFGGYPETRLNKQQFTTAKVSVGQVERLVGWRPPGASWSGELTLGRSDWLPFVLVLPIGKSNYHQYQSRKCSAHDETVAATDNETPVNPRLLTSFLLCQPDNNMPTAYSTQRRKLTVSYLVHTADNLESLNHIHMSRSEHWAVIQCSG